MFKVHNALLFAPRFDWTDGSIVDQIQERSPSIPCTSLVDVRQTRTRDLFRAIRDLCGMAGIRRTFAYCCKGLAYQYSGRYWTGRGADGEQGEQGMVLPKVKVRVACLRSH